MDGKPEPTQRRRSTTTARRCHGGLIAAVVVVAAIFPAAAAAPAEVAPSTLSPYSQTPAAPPAMHAVSPACGMSAASIVLRGASGSRREPFIVRITATGLRQVTFYLDGHKLKTLGQAQARNGQFAIRIDPRRLSHGPHTVSIKAATRDPHCAAVKKASAFVDPRPPIIKPTFTG
jgi:hypothetical protein